MKRASAKANRTAATDAMTIADHYWWFYDSELTADGGGILAVGWGFWPDDFPEDPPPEGLGRRHRPSECEVDMGKRLDLPCGITMARLQVGGMFCHQRTIFGLVFKLPPGDPLTPIGRHDRKRGCITRLKLPEVLDLRKKLAAFDLDVDPCHYHEFEEAYVPLDPARAWRYAIRRRLPLLEGPFRSGSEARFIRPEDLRLTSWTKAARFLERSWDRVDRSVEVDGQAMCFPNDPGGVVHVENCD